MDVRLDVVLLTSTIWRRHLRSAEKADHKSPHIVIECMVKCNKWGMNYDTCGRRCVMNRWTWKGGKKYVGR